MFWSRRKTEKLSSFADSCGSDLGVLSLTLLNWKPRATINSPTRKLYRIVYESISSVVLLTTERNRALINHTRLSTWWAVLVLVFHSEGWVSLEKCSIRANSPRAGEKRVTWKTNSKALALEELNYFQANIYQTGFVQCKPALFWSIRQHVVDACVTKTKIPQRCEIPLK